MKKNEDNINNLKIPIIPHLEIEQNNILRVPLLWMESNNESEGSLNCISKQLKPICNYRWDNSHYKWSNIYGHLFSFAVYAKIDKWEIHIWNQTGTQSLLDIIQPIVNKETDVLTNENYTRLSKTTEDYVRGRITCSDCKKQIEISEVGGQYFAGTYCKDCWEGKWKAIEARETYD